MRCNRVFLPCQKRDAKSCVALKVTKASCCQGGDSISKFPHIAIYLHRDPPPLDPPRIAIYSVRPALPRDSQCSGGVCQPPSYLVLLSCLGPTPVSFHLYLALWFAFCLILHAVFTRVHLCCCRHYELQLQDKVLECLASCHRNMGHHQVDHR